MSCNCKLIFFNHRQRLQKYDKINFFISKNNRNLLVIFVRTNEFSLKNFSIETVYFCELFFTDFCGKKKRPVTKALLILQTFQYYPDPSQMVFVCIQNIYKSIAQTKLC
jgi:hypothetical protein